MQKRILTEIQKKPWAIIPAFLAGVMAFLSIDSEDAVVTDKIAARSRGAAGQQMGSVAVIPVRGVIGKRADIWMELFGGTSIEGLTQSFRQAMANPGVKAIVLDVDSPGGTVDGVPELAAEMLAARGQKKVTAVANGMAASAAYWLASSAQELVVTPSGSVGSIGVFAAHEDFSGMLEAAGIKVSLISAGKYKTEGNPYEPLSAEARADMQAQVDAFYGMFVKAVAAGRKTTQTNVREGFGQGRMVLANEAVKAGMADRTATLDAVISEMAGPGATRVAASCGTRRSSNCRASSGPAHY